MPWPTSGRDAWMIFVGVCVTAFLMVKVTVIAKLLIQLVDAFSSSPGGIAIVIALLALFVALRKSSGGGSTGGH